MKKLRILTLLSSLAACGYSNNIAEGGLKNDIKISCFGLVIGMTTALFAPDFIESKVFSEIDNALDEELTGHLLAVKPKLSESLKNYYKGRVKKHGVIKAILELKKRSIDLKQFAKLEGNYAHKLLRLTSFENKLNEPNKTYKYYMNLKPLPNPAYIYPEGNFFLTVPQLAEDPVPADFNDYEEMQVYQQ